MRTQDFNPRLLPFVLILTTTLLSPAVMPQPAGGQIVDPLENGPADPDLFPSAPLATPINAPANSPQALPQTGAPSAGTQSATPPATSTGPVAASNDPCAAVQLKPLSDLGISIAQPAGKLPNDLAAPCWNQINQNDGVAAARTWSTSCYQWDATCLCHRPLYFEEINLERYGYQCGDVCCCGYECCLQPAASAAHFYGSILALPYCMAVDCPGDCVYTLGHYRPGDRNPWRWHWPPLEPLAAAAEAGVITGLIFAIP